MSETIGPRDPDAVADAFIASLRPAASSSVTTLLVGVSGGSDSVGLMIALKSAIGRLKRDDIRLVAATVDHRLRAESADEAKAVSEICRQMQIEHETLVWNDAASGASVSDRARNARYQLLQDLASRIKAQAIIVAHTFNDQAETVAMRQMRAREGEGLAGMAPAVLVGGRHWLLRPFLSVSRQDIRDGLIARGQAWIDDPTNDDCHYERVRMRQRLDEAARTKLVAVARRQAKERQDVAERAARLIEQAVTVHGAVLAEVDLSVLGTADAGVGSLVLRSLVAVCGGRSFAAGRDVRERLMDVAMSAGDGRMTAGRCVITKKRDRLFIVRENRNLPVLTLDAGESGCWDARFIITNRTASPVRIAAGQITPEEGDGCGLPASVAGQLRCATPNLSIGGGMAEGQGCRDIVVEPYLAPYEKFLPLFDLALANAIATLFRRTSFAEAAMVEHTVEIAS
ncbi:tRNA lysidine(34) synthetase TilS [Martelella alba]|nr:tRNA lysidine(34) synthetase TilS [Martelella alba]